MDNSAPPIYQINPSAPPLYPSYPNNAEHHQESLDNSPDSIYRDYPVNAACDLKTVASSECAAQVVVDINRCQKCVSVPDAKLCMYNTLGHIGLLMMQYDIAPLVAYIIACFVCFAVFPCVICLFCWLPKVTRCNSCGARPFH